MPLRNRKLQDFGRLYRSRMLQQHLSRFRFTALALYRATCARLLTAIRFVLLLVLPDVEPRPATANSPSEDKDIYVCGLGTAWPESVFTQQSFEEWVRGRYKENNPQIEKLLRINQKTGINTRHIIAPGEPAWQNSQTPPTMDQIDVVFRQQSLVLSLLACRKAIKEWGGDVSQITHTVAVTCTSSGSPGYDLEVIQQLGLNQDVESTLLHGVGCAGGLAALRAADRLLTAAASRPASVLVFACEITSIHVCPELSKIGLEPDVSVGPVLFGDGAAAILLSNEALQQTVRSLPAYKLLGCTTSRVPGTAGLMSYYAGTMGYTLNLSRDVPAAAVSAMGPAFARMREVMIEAAHSTRSAWTAKLLSPLDFDWALHPGGLSILKGAEFAMGLTRSHLEASYDVYGSKGNCSSVTVLAVLNRLRELGDGRDHVLAMSFGPGLAVETAALRRVRAD